MQKGFYKVPNCIFDYKLSPSAFYLYITLSGKYWFTNKINLSLDMLSKQCSMCITTVKTALRELAEKELLVVTEQYGKYNRRMRNQYTLRKLSGAFAKLDRNLLNLDIDNSAFMILCYLQVKCNHASIAFPSIRQMKSDLALSHTTIINKVALLNDMGIVIKMRQRTLEGDYGHNKHSVLSLHTRMCLLFLVSKMKETFTAVTGAFSALMHALERRPLLSSIVHAVEFFVLFLLNFARMILPLSKNKTAATGNSS